MSHDHEYNVELAAESTAVRRVYARLDSERARARRRYDDALRDHEGRAVDREGDVRAAAREMNRLAVAEDGVCFGRIDDDASGWYVGRIGLAADDSDIDSTIPNPEAMLLLDWRAPASRRFYTATGAHPEGLRRRRQFHSRGRELRSFTDKTLGRPAIGDSPGSGDGDAALLAAVNAPRGPGMRDIVATIQADQDRIIRSDHPGVVVIEGGPGTGKTAVALHRVAYLLYTQRARFERHGVLVVGPNTSFLRHIGRVLPSLGESDVVFATPGSLFPTVVATAAEADVHAEIKGSLAMVDVLAAAVADRRSTTAEPAAATLPHGVRITSDVVGWAREEAVAAGVPHNQARSVFYDVLTWAVTERALGRLGDGILARGDRQQWEEMRAGMLADLAQEESFRAVIEHLWPILTPESVLAELLSSADRLRAAGADARLLRAVGDAWTVSDAPLLDELGEILGPDPAAQTRTAEADAAKNSDFAADVLDSLVARADSMDDEDHLFATDMLDADALADRFVERDGRDLVERASADRTWVYRHVVVDEAQELSAMDWRVLMRRCPSHSMTVVGDLHQRSAPAGARSWSEVFERYVPGRWDYTALTVNYRTPLEIMDVAANVLARFAPTSTPPESVRSSGVRPWAERIEGGDEAIDAAILAFHREESSRAGTAVVIGPRGRAGTVPPERTKGLEFDSVLVVDPEAITADGPRGGAELYVALTRATQRLGVLYRGDMPSYLTGIAGRPAS